jgi:ribonucleoside-diphosphate reductase alpha chain
MVTDHDKDRTLSTNRSRIAQIIASYIEPMGITDRKELEEITNEVIRRLEGILPGMERLVPSPSTKQSLSNYEIMAVAREIVENKLSTMEKPASVANQTEDSIDEQPVAVSSVKTKKSDTVKKIKIGLSDNAMVVLESRYLKKDNNGKVIETPEEMFRRVAKTIASAEKKYNENADVDYWENAFYRIMANLEFLPNSPTLMNAGRELGQLSACFVIPVDDSMESIFNAVKYTALIHKSGGGTGFSFSRIRPSKDRVGSTGGVASGPVSFMRAFDTATDVIKQGGMRRGANMAILKIDHPDILDFIQAKEDMTSLTNFNLSVAVTTQFMEAVENNRNYDLINPTTKEVTNTLNAKEIFDTIIDMAWRTGDPGIIFIDNINKHNPTPHLGEIESTNPCGEQPLLPFESCNLASINLSKMTKQDGGKEVIDYDKLAETVKLGIRFLDNVIDVNEFPLPQIGEMTRNTRKIGLGVMGFADLLLRLGIAYNSDEAVKKAEEVMRFVSDQANIESEKLGEERGLFPSFAGSIYDKKDSKLKPRNASRTTIAPTGTLSIIAGCSSGIEPLFALSYERHILDGAELLEVNPYFEAAAKQENIYSTELMKQLADGKRLKDMKNIPDWVKEVFVTSHDISPEWHVKMQVAFQNYTDSAVSKTVNLPHEATQKDVADIYMTAYKEGLKGLTIYRDRSRATQVLNLGKQKEETVVKRTPRQRPKVTKGVTERVNTGCGYIYITVNFDEQGICEVFSSLGKAGGCASAQLEGISRLISLTLRSGIDISSISKQLRAIRCPSVSWEQGRLVLSCADAIASVLEKYTGEETAVHSEIVDTTNNWTAQCPECGNFLVFQEGCHICPSCGYTKCG